MYDDDYKVSRFICCFIFFVVLTYAYIEGPGIFAARVGGQFSQCESNQQKLATALEMYSTDYAGNYPSSMTLLAPEYIETIPRCPAAGRDTYSRSYSSSMGPDAYTFYCNGENHKAVGISMGNWPQYNSTEGLKSGF